MGAVKKAAKKVINLPTSPDEVVRVLLDETQDFDLALARFTEVLKRGAPMLTAVAEEYMQFVVSSPKKSAPKFDASDPDIQEAGRLEAQARKLRKKAVRRKSEMEPEQDARQRGRERYASSRDEIAKMRFADGQNILDQTVANIQRYGGWFDSIVRALPPEAKLGDRLGKFLNLDQLTKMRDAG